MQIPQIFHPDNGGAPALVEHWLKKGIDKVLMPTNGNFAGQKKFPQTASTTRGACQLTVDEFLADLSAEERAKYGAFVSLDTDKALEAFHAPQNHPKQIGFFQEERAGNIAKIIGAHMGDKVGSVDAFLYDLEKDNEIARGVQLWELQKLAAANGIRFVSTTKLGPYGLPGQAPLEYAELFENVAICPFPTNTNEQPTFLDKANENARASTYPVIGMPQGRLINLFDTASLSAGKNVQGEVVELTLSPTLGRHGAPYLHAALPHAEYFPVAGTTPG